MQLIESAVFFQGIDEAVHFLTGTRQEAERIIINPSQMLWSQASLSGCCV
jgi:hypothetical protein